VTDDLAITVDGHVATIQIRRAPSNYFDSDLLRRIADACQELDSAGEVRSLVLCSEGRNFCAGADFQSGDLKSDRERAAAELYGQAVRIFEVELPIVAAVQGFAVGGGLGLACAADFRVATTQSHFWGNFSLLGFHHGFALSVTLPRIVGEQAALNMLISARRVDGSEALVMGLVDRLATDDSLLASAQEFAVELASRSPLATRSIKRTMRRGIVNQARAAMDLELAEQGRLWLTADSEIGLEANRNRQPPRFIGR
jgi:enoyl-CoA hydratase/carnithine racemase